MSLHRHRSREQQTRIRVLQISDDANLAISRLLLLHNQGYYAEHVLSTQVPDFQEVSEFQIFLICQSIDPQLAAQMIARIRREVPLSYILRVRNMGQVYEPPADLTLAPPAGPFQLLRGLQSLATTLTPGGQQA